MCLLLLAFLVMMMALLPEEKDDTGGSRNEGEVEKEVLFAVGAHACED